MSKKSLTKSTEERLTPTPMGSGSYSPNDVVFLLKDLKGLIDETGLQQREENIQSGGHYSEMLPIEYQPTLDYMKLFYKMLNESAGKVALAVGKVSELILKRNGPKVILVSLARAGTPIGVLIKRYILNYYGLDLFHYSISIIRDKGIDENALHYIIQKHPEAKLQFIDGWTGKGTITSVLSQACRMFESQYGYPLDDDLAVLADPGHCVQTFGTREDFLIPSACLNSTVSGLISRTVCRDDLIGENDFHGAKFYQELREDDVSNLFINRITTEFKTIREKAIKEVAKHYENYPSVTWQGLKDIKLIQERLGIEDINFIKPGVGETTRVLLRRLPWKILVDKCSNPNLRHILVLALDKGVVVEEYPQLTYSCCGIVKNLKES
ncbi:MAG: cysteine protease StiP family protein [Desulfitobacteriaceae bacterium]